MNSYWDEAYTIQKRCSLSLLTTPNTDSLGYSALGSPATERLEIMVTYFFCRLWVFWQRAANYKLRVRCLCDRSLPSSEQQFCVRVHPSPKTLLKSITKFLSLSNPSLEELRGLATYYTANEWQFCLASADNSIRKFFVKDLVGSLEQTSSK